MKNNKAVFAMLLLLISNSVFASFEDTPPQLIKGLATGRFGTEVSFDDMSNSQGCGFNGAYVLEPTLGVHAKNRILSLLIFAKQKGLTVRVRLNGCTDRPKFNNVFVDVGWLWQENEACHQYLAANNGRNNGVRSRIRMLSIDRKSSDRVKIILSRFINDANLFMLVRIIKTPA